MTPTEVRDALPVIQSRCEEIGRDPRSLSVSIHVWWEQLTTPGQQRVDMLGDYAELGLSRVIGMVRESVDSDDALAQIGRAHV